MADLDAEYAEYDEAFQTALRQMDGLTAYLRRHQSVSCAAAEEEDAVLMRLADWQTGLRPHHHAAIAEIGRYYRKYVPSDKGCGAEPQENPAAE